MPAKVLINQGYRADTGVIVGNEVISLLQFSIMENNYELAELLLEQFDDNPLIESNKLPTIGGDRAFSSTNPLTAILDKDSVNLRLLEQFLTKLNALYPEKRLKQEIKLIIRRAVDNTSKVSLFHYIVDRVIKMNNSINDELTTELSQYLVQKTFEEGDLSQLQWLAQHQLNLNTLTHEQKQKVITVTMCKKHIIKLSYAIKTYPEILQQPNLLSTLNNQLFKTDNDITVWRELLNAQIVTLHQLIPFAAQYGSIMQYDFIIEEVLKFNDKQLTSQLVQATVERGNASNLKILADKSDNSQYRYLDIDNKIYLAIIHSRMQRGPQRQQFRESVIANGLAKKLSIIALPLKHLADGQQSATFKNALLIKDARLASPGSLYITSDDWLFLFMNPAPPAVEIDAYLNQLLPVKSMAPILCKYMDIIKTYFKQKNKEDTVWMQVTKKDFRNGGQGYSVLCKNKDRVWLDLNLIYGGIDPSKFESAAEFYLFQEEILPFINREFPILSALSCDELRWQRLTLASEITENLNTSTKASTEQANADSSPAKKDTKVPVETPLSANPFATFTTAEGKACKHTQQQAVQLSLLP